MGSARTGTNVHFKIHLGGAIDVVEATLSVFLLGAPDRTAVTSASLTSNAHSWDFGQINSASAFVVAFIQKISIDGETIDVNGVVQLASAFDLGEAEVTLTEHSTIAMAYCFAQFLEIEADGQILMNDPNGASSVALKMTGNFVDSATGDLSKVITSPPNGLQTNSLAVLNSLANIVNHAIAEPDVYDQFIRLTGANSLFEALHNLALDPFQNVVEIYDLSANRGQIFSPSLPMLRPPATPIPNQWSLAIKVNGSGAENFLISGTGYLAFDCNDRVWVSNNTRQGTPNSSTFVTVLEPDGSPAHFSPLFGGGLLGGGIGITTNHSGDKVFVGNFGWGPEEYNPQYGSISAFTADGEALSPSEGFTNELSRAQGMAFDSKGNLWICSWGTQKPLAPATSILSFADENSKVVVYKNGNPKDALVYEITHPLSPFHGPFGIAIDEHDNCFIASQGDKTNRIRSSVVKLCLEDDEIEELARWTSDFVTTNESGEPTGDVGVESFKMMAIGPHGHIFVGGIASNRIVRLDQDLNYIGDITNMMYSPWGVTFDADNVLYAANFAGEMDENSDKHRFGEEAFGITIVKDGDQSTAQFMTLPTGGEPVTLANGLPLYGNGNPNLTRHCFHPLMRMTSSRVDRAGNLWACNNWKPLVINDFLRGDPGGDGLVIFVGVAAT